MTEEKGHIYLLKAVKKVVKNYPKVKFLIIGDGFLMKILKLESERLNLGNVIIFTGTRDDICDILSAIDIFVMPSLKEGMPMALLEAMAAKKAVIATKIGAIPEVIEKGYTGLLVEPKDVGKLSNSIIELLKNKKKAYFLAQNGYEIVKNEFSSGKMAGKYTQIYK